MLTVWNSIKRRRLAEAGDRAVLKPAESAKVVQSGNVINVVVCIQNGIDSADIVGQALQP